MLFTDKEIEHAYRSLIEQQSLFKTVFSSVVGCVVGLDIFAFLAGADGVMLVFILLPSFISGGLSASLGKPFSAGYRAIVGGFGLLSFVIGGVFIAQVNPLFWILAPSSFLISYWLSKPRMTVVQEHAVWLKSVNRKP